MWGVRPSDQTAWPPLGSHAHSDGNLLHLASGTLASVSSLATGNRRLGVGSMEACAALERTPWGDLEQIQKEPSKTHPGAESSQLNGS